MTHLLGFISNGVFERYPDLKVVLAGGGVGWLTALLWRLDTNFKGVKREIPWVKSLPSEYVARHVRLDDLSARGGARRAARPDCRAGRRRNAADLRERVAARRRGASCRRPRRLPRGVGSRSAVRERPIHLWPLTPGSPPHGRAGQSTRGPSAIRRGSRPARAGGPARDRSRPVGQSLLRRAQPLPTRPRAPVPRASGPSGAGRGRTGLDCGRRQAPGHHLPVARLGVRAGERLRHHHPRLRVRTYRTFVENKQVYIDPTTSIEADKEAL